MLLRPLGSPSATLSWPLGETEASPRSVEEGTTKRTQVIIDCNCRNWSLNINVSAGDLISSLHSEYSCLLGHLLSHDYSFGDVESDAHYAGDSKLHASLHTCPLLVPSLTGPRGGCAILANRRPVNNTNTMELGHSYWFSWRSFWDENYCRITFWRMRGHMVQDYSSPATATLGQPVPLTF